ncbi:MAG: hypothetical protein ACREDD_10625 [Methylocella sp.]
MILDYDKDLENLVRSYIPHWTEFRVRKSRFVQRDENSLASLSIMFVGKTSLLCGMDAKDVPGTIWEYHPIYLKEVDEKAYDPGEWITLLRDGGATEIEKKAQWLFEKPSLRLLVSGEELAEGMEPDARKHLLKFYGGIELSDPTRTKHLQVCACGDPIEFVVNARFIF